MKSFSPIQNALSAIGVIVTAVTGLTCKVLIIIYLFKEII